MATEAQNIMQAFRAAEVEQQVKKEQRMLKKGPLGYIGGVTGFVEDVTGGVLGAQTAMNVLETYRNIRDPRDFGEMTDDSLNSLRADFKNFMDESVEEVKNMYVNATETEVDLFNQAIDIGEGKF
jgi:hypothetical protein